MAIRKVMALDNGVEVTYHRVVSVNTITNVQNVIEVASYTTAAKREEEKDYIESGDYTGMNIYISTMFVNADYDQSMTIRDAYDYIKTLPDFEGATDIID